MRKVIAIILVGAVLALASNAMAGEKVCMWPYLGLIGSGSIDVGGGADLGSGYSVAGVGGLEFCNSRVELEVATRENNVNSRFGVKTDGDISMMTYIMNGYWEIDAGSKKWRPYLGGGFGIVDGEISSLRGLNGDLVSSSDRDTAFAYQGIMGAGIFLTNKFVLDIQYRYFSTTKLRFGMQDETFGTHNLGIGGRWRF